jgi:hypothetical protein
MIQNRLQSSPRTRRSRKKIVAIASALLVFTYIVTIPNSASAYGWITKFFMEVQGTVTQVMVSTGVSDQAGPKAPPMAIVQHEETRIVKMSLEEAQKAASFRIIVPTALPEDYLLQEVLVQQTGSKKSDFVVIKYSNGRDFMDIRQNNTGVQSAYTIGVDNEDTTIERIEVNSRSLDLFSFKDNTRRLVWMEHNIRIVIDGLLTEEEIITAAESMIQ